MKIALICPSNMLYMPYVGNYEKILKENDVKYDIINWDRFNIEDEDNSLTYRDTKIGHQRNFIDYYKFKKFVIKNLNSIKYDKVIVFGIQLAFFLKGILQKKFNGNFIIDIRDYNKIINYYNIWKIVNDSSFTVLSSPGFKEWLPCSNKYIINHNTQINNIDELIGLSNSAINREKINIAYIGSIRDYKINVNFIDSLQNSSAIYLYFHGEGVINKDIDSYLNANDIRNVKLTGRYRKEDEECLYLKTDLVNILIPENHFNSKTLLPNRLYNAVLYGKPIITFKGTYLADQISKYNIGLVLDSFDRVEGEVNRYLKEFDLDEYDKGRNVFFDKVIKENREFRVRVVDFIK